MRPVVFLGPSLAHKEASAILDADYRPPVRRGDLVALPEGTKVVAIIDGMLLSEAAVGHREILALLKKGVKVYGGGSMGALRAAELSDFGMIGLGKVYEAYASGRVEGDDEVVLSFDPFTLSALSEPLINLRFNLEKAVEQGAMGPKDAERIIDELKRVYYPKRSFSLMIEIARNILDSVNYSKLEKFISTGFEDFKKNDAISVLKTVKKNE